MAKYEDHSLLSQCYNSRQSDMNRTKEDLIQYRLQKANETFDRAKFSISKKYWNAAASELYYTCFYLVLALFAKNDLNASTHKAVNSLFALHFYKGG